MDRPSSPEVIQCRTRRKHYTRHLSKGKKPASILTKTSTPDEQGSRTKTFIQSWLHSCNDSEELCIEKIPAILPSDPEHKKVTRQSRSTSQRVKYNTSVKSKKAGKSPQSNLENKQPEPVCIESDTTSAEDLFGFEKLLEDNEPQNIRKSNQDQLSLKHKSTDALSSTVLTERHPLHKKSTPWSGLLDSPQQKGKSMNKITKTRKKKVNTEKIKEEVFLFGENTSSPTVENKYTISTNRDIRFEDSDSDHSSGHIKELDTKKVSQKRNPPRPIVPDIPWKEIMEHELVIE